MKQSIPIALQLYSVRDELADDFEGVIRKVAEFGYAGVEPVDFVVPKGISYSDAGKLFKELNLHVPSVYMSSKTDKDSMLETAAQFNSKRIILSADLFDDVDDIKRTCDFYNEVYLMAKENDLEFAVHNHIHEFLNVKGRLAHQIMLEYLDPGISFEIDAYFVKMAGQDPVEIIKNLGRRVKLLHVRDGSLRKGEHHVSVGKGVMDYPSIIHAAVHADWLIVEFSSCATDIMEAVRESLIYLENLEI